ncbi:MAG: hypothetical protein M1831_003741 [Alyxoria varia]|nr:MAG: hypothetical protein M1831_003741 [Alyxoria varia]
MPSIPIPIPNAVTILAAKGKTKKNQQPQRTFHPFLSLPPELRLKVYHHYISPFLKGHGPCARPGEAIKHLHLEPREASEANQARHQPRWSTAGPTTRPLVSSLRLLQVSTQGLLHSHPLIRAELLNFLATGYCYRVSFRDLEHLLAGPRSFPSHRKSGGCLGIRRRTTQDEKRRKDAATRRAIFGSDWRLRPCAQTLDRKMIPRVRPELVGRIRHIQLHVVVHVSASKRMSGGDFVGYHDDGVWRLAMEEGFFPALRSVEFVLTKEARGQWDAFLVVRRILAVFDGAETLMAEGARRREDREGAGEGDVDDVVGAGRRGGTLMGGVFGGLREVFREYQRVHIWR